MANPQNQKPPFALRALGAFAATLAVLFALLLAAYALPGGPVRDHVYTSAQTIAEEGLYPEYFGFKLFQMDNYTDTVMLFEAASADEAPPLTAMMTNTAYNVNNFETLAEDLQWYIEKDLSTGAQRTDAPALVPFSYARYWHGYLIWLRPLLLVTTITGVRIVQYAVLLALLAAVLWLLRRRCGLRACLWFAVSQLLVTVFWVPHQVQYFTCFARAVSGCWQSHAAAMPSALRCWCWGRQRPSVICWSRRSLRWGCRWSAGCWSRSSACAPVCRSAALWWVAAFAGAWGICSAGRPSGCWRGLSPDRMLLPMRCIRWGCVPPPIHGTAWN